MRVSNQWVTKSFLTVLNKNHTALSKLQVQISSGKQYSLASENPVSNALSMAYKTQISETSQYKKNISTTTTWLNSADSALTTAFWTGDLDEFERVLHKYERFALGEFERAQQCQ